MQLLALRRSEPVLARGGYERWWHEGEVLAWIRSDGSSRFLVALNFAGSVSLGPNEGVMVRPEAR